MAARRRDPADPRRREPRSEEIADVATHEDRRGEVDDERCATCGEVVSDVGMFGCTCLFGATQRFPGTVLQRRRRR